MRAVTAGDIGSSKLLARVRNTRSRRSEEKPQTPSRSPAESMPAASAASASRAVSMTLVSPTAASVEREQSIRIATERSRATGARRLPDPVAAGRPGADRDPAGDGGVEVEVAAVELARQQDAARVQRRELAAHAGDEARVGGEAGARARPRPRARGHGRASARGRGGSTRDR